MRSMLRIFPDLQSLSQAASEIFIRSSALAIKARGRFLVAVSGGSTPTTMFSLLADPARQNQVDWARAWVFWVDERCVPANQPGSNYGQAHQLLLQHVPIPAGNVLRVRGELPPGQAADEYAATLKAHASPPLNWPRFDLVLLGMGEDGHTASLFPGSPVENASPTLAVTATYQDRPADRVTLTPQVINSAREVVFLVSGASKASALASVLEGQQAPQGFPAQRIRPADGELVWLADEAAASRLSKRSPST